MIGISAPAKYGDLIDWLKQLDQLIADTSVEMSGLVRQFESMFSTSPFTLAFHTSAGVRSVRWRMNDRGQQHFELCTSDLGERVLREQPSQIVDLLIGYDEQRLSLNYTFQTAFYLRKRLRRLRKARSAVKDMRTRFGSRAA